MPEAPLSWINSCRRLHPFFSAVLVSAAAIAFLCGAAYFALLNVASPAIAALVTGLGALVFAVLIVMAGRLLSRRKRAASRRQDRGEADEGLGKRERTAGELSGLLGAEIASVARSNMRGTLLASLIAGFAIGASTRLRKILLDLIFPR